MFLFDLKNKKLNMKMVDEDGWMWNLELKMIPNDRPRSSLGSPGVFGPKIPIFGFPRGSPTPGPSRNFTILRRIPIQTAGPISKK